MEIENIEELKNLIREIVKEELNKENQPTKNSNEEEKVDNTHEIDQVRERISQIPNQDETPRAIPSTPLSPGIHSADSTPTGTNQPPTTQQQIDDMEI